MEIIQTYESDEVEVCIVSNGNTVYFVDSKDIAAEAKSVGVIVRPSEVKEFYLELPINELQEAARRSQAHVDPDAPGEEIGGGSSDSDSDEEEEEEEEEEAAAPPDWKPIAEEKFLARYRELDEGIPIRILQPIDIKVRWEDEEAASWELQSGGIGYVSDFVSDNENLTLAVERMTDRIKAFVGDIKVFAQEQAALGHDDLAPDDFVDAKEVVLDHLGIADSIKQQGLAAE